MLVYFGFFYIFVGIVFLLVPLIYLELGRTKDLLKAFLNLLIGLILILKNKTLDESFVLIFLFFTVLAAIYLAEIFSFRWNQLTEKEKNKLTTFLELKNNLSKLLEAFNLGVKNFTQSLNFFNFNNNQNMSSKKWVRNAKNDNIKT